MARGPLLIGLVFAGWVIACGSSRQDFVTPDAGGDGSIIGPGSDGTAPAPTVVGHLTGKVFAPEGTIPISGALIYLAVGKPATQTKGVYCDKCVELTATTAYTYSKPDGTFDLGAHYEGEQWLVVQKGQFRRARPFTVTAPTQVVPAPLSTLPGKSNPDAGDEIPRMAVVQAQWDKIEVSLARLGLGVVTKDFLNQPQVKPSDANFDIVDPTLFDSAQKLAQYNIVFAGCSFSSGTTCNTSQPAGNSTVQKNLQDFVKAGGKLYTSDYSYELVRQPWPGFVHWVVYNMTLGASGQSGAHTAQVHLSGKNDLLLRCQVPREVRGRSAEVHGAAQAGRASSASAVGHLLPLSHGSRGQAVRPWSLSEGRHGAQLAIGKQTCDLILGCEPYRMSGKDSPQSTEIHLPTCR